MACFLLSTYSAKELTSTCCQLRTTLRVCREFNGDLKKTKEKADTRRIKSAKLSTNQINDSSSLGV